jgi:AAA+ ATPase superfamily predicted ATPase
MNFFGRARELSVLTKAATGEASGFIPVYGRRRVGKSELIVHFMTRRKGLYFVGKRAPAELQLREFMETASDVLGDPLLARVQVQGWRDALSLVLSRWKHKTKLILALDEFQWMVEASPELPSVIQELWDRDWSRSGKVLLILCGSYLGFMEREVLGKKSPLFGRRTAQILLRPFDFLEAASFHPHLSAVDHARVYAICGGVPMYLRWFERGQSVEQNIMAQLLDENAPLAREPEFLLREELRDLMPYHAVLMGLAQGKTNPAQLARAVGLDVRAQNYHLSTLMELGYVQRRHPVSSAQPANKEVRYALDDPLLRFWFRFVFPHQSALRSQGPERGFAQYVAPELDAYMGRCFERLCREALPLIYAGERVTAAHTTGEFWNVKTQIDVVGVREDGVTDLGECKWGKPGSLLALATELAAKAAYFPNTRQATLQQLLFLRDTPGKAARPENVKIYTLADLYALKSQTTPSPSTEVKRTLRGRKHASG